MKLEPKEDRLVVGVTGPIGSGVSTVTKALEEGSHEFLKKFRIVRISDPIKETLRLQENIPAHVTIDENNVEGYRRKLQEIGDEGRETNGLQFWLEKAFDPIKMNGHDIVVDGIRNLGEVAALRRAFSRFFLISVQASFDVRWERVRNKYKGNQAQFLEDDERDSDEDIIHGQQVSKCTLDSDFAFVNENDLKDKSSQKKSIFENLKTNLLWMKHFDTSELPDHFVRMPTHDEVHMATAYSQSQRSRCLKRHVGAVIVNHRGIPLSVGFNENPTPLNSCSTEQFDKICFKDGYTQKKLESMGPFFCPRCGTKHESIGYPWKCTNSKCGAPDLKKLLFPSRGIELCTAIHAEERAIRSLGQQNAEGGTIYSSTFPCLQCCRYIIDAGIKQVIYVEPYPIPEAVELLEKGKVTMTPFVGFKARAFNQVFKQVK